MALRLESALSQMISLTTKGLLASRKTRIGFLVALCLLVLIFTVGWWFHRHDSAKIRLTVSLDESEFPPGDYYDVAWINRSLIAFLYLPLTNYLPDRIPQLWDLQLILYDLDTKQWRPGPIPQIDGCITSGMGSIARLPNQALGFLYRCNSKDRRLAGVTLYMWDSTVDDLRSLEHYPEPFRAARFAFAPDMSVFIQENAVGVGLNNELYRVTIDGRMERLFPAWQRASQPSWSSDGRYIAFIGTQDIVQDVQSIDQIETLARQDWDMYVMEADGRNLRIVVPSVNVGRLQWLPNSSQLVFSGALDGSPGIWVIGVNPTLPVQIWPEWTLFDMAPDGTQAVILRKMEYYGGDLYRPIIVNIPAELYSATDVGR